MSHTPRKVALITGAARRIGQKIAEILADSGFDVALHTSARSAGDGERLCAALQTTGQTVFHVIADLESAAQTTALMPKVAAKLGPVTLLINNASMFEADSAMGFESAVLDRHMAVNLRAPLILASALAAGLPPGESGNIINIIDQRVWRLTPNFFSYTLSKAALWTATQTMAQALAPHVRVNAIGPGPTIASARQDPADFARQAGAVLLRQRVEPEAIAEAVLYLAHARSVTGQMIAVDGGQHLAWETPDVINMVE